MTERTDERLGLIHIPLTWMLAALGLLTAVSPWTASAPISRVIVVAQMALGSLLIAVCVVVAPKGKAPWYYLMAVTLLGGYLALHGLIDRTLDPQHAVAFVDVLLVLRMWLPYLWFVASGRLMLDDGFRKAVLCGLVVGGLVMSVGVVLTSAGVFRGDVVPYWGLVGTNRPFNANEMATSLALGLVVLDYLTRRWQRLGLTGLAKGLIIIAIALTFSRMGYVILLALLITRVFNKVDLATILALLLFAGVILFGKTSIAMLVAGRVSYTWVSGGLDVSSSTRILLWQEGLRDFWRHPLWGIGLGNPLELSPAAVYLENSVAGLSYQHNQLISLLAETGLFGALLWLGWGFLTWRVSNSAARLGRRVMRLTLIAVAIASLTSDPFFSTSTVWMVMILVAWGVFDRDHPDVEGAAP